MTNPRFIAARYDDPSGWQPRVGHQSPVGEWGLWDDLLRDWLHDDSALTRAEAEGLATQLNSMEDALWQLAREMCKRTASTSAWRGNTEATQ